MYRNCLVFVFCALLSVSCVKESRQNCPCYLYFAHDGFSFNGRTGSVRVTAMEQKAVVLRDEYMVPELLADRADVGVPRGMAEVSVCSGIVNMAAPKDSLLMIPKGNECDSLFVVSDEVLAFGERAKVYGVLRKQYAKVTVDFVYADTTSAYPYSFVAKSGTAGMNIFTLKPVKGDYSYVPMQISRGVFSFNLPRQSDDDLVLEVYENNVKKSEIALGKYIMDTLYYDWKAESLADIDIIYELALSRMTIRVNDWGLEQMFTITI